MIFPLRTDRRLQHVPWVNIALIGGCFIVWAMQIRGEVAGQEWFASLTLNPRQPVWYQFITYQFLHSSWEHIIFNMLFLYVFGNSMEDRLGPVGYGAFYLSGGIVAGIGHMLTSDAPVLGASGSVSAVTGGFLALFPRSHVTVVWFLLIIDTFEVQSMWLILLAVMQDLFFQLLGSVRPGAGSNVAYMAHLSGNAFGFTVGMLLLATRILPREAYDFLALMERWRRRRSFKGVASSGASPWAGEATQTMPTLTPADEARSREIMAVRASIADALTQGRPAEALDAYEDLLAMDPRQAMPRQSQLDLANYAMDSGRHEVAAAAYERFLAAFPSDGDADQIALILGLVYARYLHDAGRARPLLERAAGRLADPARRRMAQEMLAELGG